MSDLDDVVEELVSADAMPGRDYVVLPRAALFEWLGAVALPPWPDADGHHVLGGDVDCAPIAERLIQWVEQNDLSADGMGLDEDGDHEFIYARFEGGRDEAKEWMLGRLRPFLTDECPDCRQRGTEEYESLQALDGPVWAGEVEGNDYWLAPSTAKWAQAVLNNGLDAISEDGVPDEGVR